MHSIHVSEVKRLVHKISMPFVIINTYLLSPWSWFLLEKLAGSQLVKKLPVFHGTRRFITAFKSARHLSLPWARSIQSMPPHPTSWRSILILFSHLRLGLRSCLLPSGFPTRPHALLDLITQNILREDNRSLISSLCSFLHFPVSSSILGPNILISTLFSNTLSLRSSLNVSAQVSHPYKI